MEQAYLIDTNVIVDNFGNKLSEKAKQFLYSIDIIVSNVTKIEVLGWLNASSEQLAPLYRFMETVSILQIDNAVVQKTIAIRQRKKIGLGDAIIAATALAHNMTLVTRNTSDFKNIEGIVVINPYEL